MKFWSCTEEWWSCSCTGSMFWLYEVPPEPQTPATCRDLSALQLLTVIYHRVGWTWDLRENLEFSDFGLNTEKPFYISDVERAYSMLPQSLYLLLGTLWVRGETLMTKVFFVFGRNCRSRYMFWSLQASLKQLRIFFCFAVCVEAYFHKAADCKLG